MLKDGIFTRATSKPKRFDWSETDLTGFDKSHGFRKLIYPRLSRQLHVQS